MQIILVPRSNDVTVTVEPYSHEGLGTRLGKVSNLNCNNSFTSACPYQLYHIQCYYATGEKKLAIVHSKLSDVGRGE